MTEFKHGGVYDYRGHLYYGVRDMQSGEILLLRTTDSSVNSYKGQEHLFKPYFTGGKVSLDKEENVMKIIVDWPTARR